MANSLATFSKEIDTKLIDPLRNVLKGRKLVAVTPEKGFGITSVDWGKITDVSDGLVSYGFSDGNVDAIHVALTNSKVPVYWKDFKVDRRVYEGWRVRGIDVDAASAIAAGYKAAKAEDAAIVMGVTNDGTNYDINGLYQGAGNDYSTSADFGTAGNATAALAGAYNLMDADGIPVDSLAFNMALSSVQYQQLLASRFTNGQRELPDILDMLNGGSVFSVGTVLTAGTGMVLPNPAVGEPYVDFYLTSDFKTEHGVDAKHPDTGDLNGRVYSAGILRIKQDVAICKLSVI
jgi:uncharacterized linocin/CFP29 family protein